MTDRVTPDHDDARPVAPAAPTVGRATPAGPPRMPESTAAPTRRAENGAYRIWPQTSALRNIGDPLGSDPPNPTDPTAVEIYFGVVDPLREIPPMQATLAADLDRTLRAVNRLYVETQPPRPDRFRFYYVRLFNLAQLGLEGYASPDAARAGLQACVDDLIDDEAGRVKNGHLRLLGERALQFAAPFAIAYLLLSEWGRAPFATAAFAHLGASVASLRAFALLWIGCFAGVWLSYGIRTTTFTLSDLVTTDADRLQPALRLIFAGMLTMIVGLLCALGFVEFRIGEHSLTKMADDPMLAFLLGALCGISELTLPSSISKRASSLFGKLG